MWSRRIDRGAPQDGIEAFERQHADALGAAELNARLGISTGSATEPVDRLEQAGHLERSPHPTDRRRKVLAPTEATVGRVLSALRPLSERVDALAATFTPGEQAVIERHLRAVTGCFLDFAHPAPEEQSSVPGPEKDPSP